MAVFTVFAKEFDMKNDTIDFQWCLKLVETVSVNTAAQKLIGISISFHVKITSEIG